MYKAIVSMLVGAILGSTLSADESVVAKIRNSTWSLKVDCVVGFEHDSPTWRRPRTDKDGKLIEHEKLIRAVCLGTEDDKLVFFTLRSFIDPFYPNPFIQGLPSNSLSFRGSSKDSEYKTGSRSNVIRYGTIQLENVAHGGGGILRSVLSTNSLITHYDERRRFDKRPHAGLDVATHDYFYEKGKDHAIEISTFGFHDVVLIYVPTALVENPLATPDEKQKAANLWRQIEEFRTELSALPDGAEGRQGVTETIRHLKMRLPYNLPQMIDQRSLNLTHPTATTRLALERGEELFGVPFYFMGAQTLSSVVNYKGMEIIRERVIKEDIVKTGAFPTIGRIVEGALAMAPKAFAALKMVDDALGLVFKDSTPSFKEITKKDNLRMIGITIASQRLNAELAKRR